MEGTPIIPLEGHGDGAAEPNFHQLQPSGGWDLARSSSAKVSSGVGAKEDVGS